MADKPIAVAAEAFRTAAADFGANKDDQVGVVVNAAADLANALEAAFPIDREAFARTVRAELRGSITGMLRAAGWIGYAACTASLAVGIGIGFAGCWAVRDGSASVTASQLQAAFADGASGAAWLAGVAKNNDLAGLEKQCSQMRYQSDGGLACSVLLWDRAPPAKR